MRGSGSGRLGQSVQKVKNLNGVCGSDKQTESMVVVWNKSDIIQYFFFFCTCTNYFLKKEIFSHHKNLYQNKIIEATNLAIFI